MARTFKKNSIELDGFDRAILRILQEDNKKPQRQIAEQVALSAPSVQRRISAMEEHGIITRNAAEIERQALGLGITAIVEVRLMNEQSATLAAAKAAFTKVAEVQQCYYVTGGLSFVLVIVTRNMQEYDQLTQRLFSDNPDVEIFRSLLALECVKTGNSLLVQDE